MRETPMLLNEPKPVVLIVDDNPNILKDERHHFERLGCQVIDAQTKEDAFRIFVSATDIDLVFTDINLDPGEAGQSVRDQSGVDLAKIISEQLQGLPVVGFSAKFSKDDLDSLMTENVAVSSGLSDTFAKVLPKGAMPSQDRMQQYLEYKQLALQHMRDRMRSIQDDELARIQSKYGLMEKDLELLRELFSNQCFEPQSVEDLLSHMGLEMTILDAGEERPTETGSQICSAAVPVWTQCHDLNTYSAHLHGFPAITVAAESPRVAVDDLLLKLDKVYAEFKGDRKPHSQEEEDLFDFLQRAFD